MKTNFKDTPRKFTIGKEQDIEISDLGTIELEANEQVSFVVDGNKEYDFAAKNWGFYATPSINGRLKRFGFKTALVKNNSNQIFLMVVNADKMADFEAYCTKEEQEVLEWLDER